MMSVTCLFSKWVELYPLQNKSGPEVAKNLHSFIMRHGAPESFISDQGREFVNQVNSALFDVFNVRHMVTAAYQPQTTAHRAANVGTPDSPWVQVMHIPERQHWILASTVNCQPGTVKFYDSLRQPIPRPSQKLKEQLCHMTVTSYIWNGRM